MSSVRIRIADLKARLSEHLRSVRNGGTVTVLDRDTPVAQIVPFTTPSLEVRKAKRRLRDLKLPRKPARRTDSVALLVDDRRRR
jgi:antitoxin (DNA-binding transcriptional repressor) of toxin-antitoxin stability system